MVANTQNALDIDQIVDLQRYPIHRLRSANGRELVDCCRLQLAESGACMLVDASGR